MADDRKTSREDAARKRESVRGDEADPGATGAGENICPACEGTGRTQGLPCPNCGGTGKIVEGIGGG